MMNIIMAEFGDIRYDARVLKEAYSLAKSGFFVSLLMFNRSIDSINIKREKNLLRVEFPYPLHSETQNFQKRFFRYMSGIQIILRIWIYILNNRADYYHMHNLFFLIPGLIATKKYNAKLIYDAHELHCEKWPKIKFGKRILNKFNFFYEKFFISKSDLLIEASEERADYINNFVQRNNKTLVIENNVYKYFLGSKNTKNNYFYKKCNLHVGSKILIYCGGIRLGQQRKQDRIIEILKSLDENIHFVLIGRAAKHDVLGIKKLSEKHNVQNRVHILDPVPYKDLVKILADAHISIMPFDAMGSLNYEYSAFNKISESCMAGIPILTSNYNNLRRIILENPIGPVGEVFDIESDKSIINAIQNSLEKEKYVYYASNAIKLAHEYLNWEKEEEKLLRSYNQMIDR